MVDISDEEFSAYVFGSLPEDRNREIERMAIDNEELAAEIELFRMLFRSSSAGDQRPVPVGVEAVGTTPLPEPQRRWLSTYVGLHKRLAAAVLAAALLTGMAVGAWAILADRPLLEDDFNDRSFDAYLWMHQPEVTRRFNEPMGISEQNGYVKLVNRGYLITREEFPGPISLSLDWSWSELGPRLDPLYAESLTVALRTTGKVAPRHPYEIRDGVLVVFNVWGPFVHVRQRLGGEDTVLGSTEEPGPPLKLPMPADEWQSIRITDDGATIRVYMTGPEIAERYAETPLLEVRCTEKFEGRHIAIYNRELVGSPHESLIDNVVIRAMPTKE